MRPEDATRVRHIIEASEVIGEFVKGRRRLELDADRMLLFALIRAIEVIGEAASKLSPEAQSMAPGVPWSAIVAMRNRLIHAYFDIDNETVWRTATEEVPRLVAGLQALMRDR